jgi:hypothetical protein
MIHVEVRGLRQLRLEPGSYISVHVNPCDSSGKQVASFQSPFQVGAQTLNLDFAPSLEIPGNEILVESVQISVWMQLLPAQPVLIGGYHFHSKPYRDVLYDGWYSLSANPDSAAHSLESLGQVLVLVNLPFVPPFREPVHPTFSGLSVTICAVRDLPTALSTQVVLALRDERHVRVASFTTPPAAASTDPLFNSTWFAEARGGRLTASLMEAATGRLLGQTVLDLATVDERIDGWFELTTPKDVEPAEATPDKKRATANSTKGDEGQSKMEKKGQKSKKPASAVDFSATPRTDPRSQARAIFLEVLFRPSSHAAGLSVAVLAARDLGDAPLPPGADPLHAPPAPPPVYVRVLLEDGGMPLQEARSQPAADFRGTCAWNFKCAFEPHVLELCALPELRVQLWSPPHTAHAHRHTDPSADPLDSQAKDPDNCISELRLPLSSLGRLPSLGWVRTGTLPDGPGNSHAVNAFPPRQPRRPWVQLELKGLLPALMPHAVACRGEALPEAQVPSGPLSLSDRGWQPAAVMCGSRGAAGLLLLVGGDSRSFSLSGLDIGAQTALPLGGNNLQPTPPLPGPGSPSDISPSALAPPPPAWMPLATCALDGITQDGKHSGAGSGSGSGSGSGAMQPALELPALTAPTPSLLKGFETAANSPRPVSVSCADVQVPLHFRFVSFGLAENRTTSAHFFVLYCSLRRATGWCLGSATGACRPGPWCGRPRHRHRRR